VLAAIVAVVAVSSWPVVAAALEGERPTAAQRGLARHVRGQDWGVSGSQVKEPSRYAPTPEAYERRSSNMLERLLRGAAPPSFASAEGREAVPRGNIELLDRADDDGDSVLTANPSMKLLVSKDLGGWLLVAIHRYGRAQYGWVRRQQVVILP